MLSGRLGLETARVPHADRVGMLWLSYGNLYVADGCLRFTAAGGDIPVGDHQIPYQNVSLILLGPGTTISQDAMRLCARHNTGFVAVGAGGVRMYSAPPLSPDQSRSARAQVRLWSDVHGGRMLVARKMYAMRFGEVPPHNDICSLRGVEGWRVKEGYKILADKFGIAWDGRHYDRNNPEASDAPNQAINHAATAVEAAAMIAVAATGTIPALGFIHEDSGMSWVLDIADLVRTEVTVPIAFAACKAYSADPDKPLERHVRRIANETFHKKKLIPDFIDRIHNLLDISE